MTSLLHSTRATDGPTAVRRAVRSPWAWAAVLALAGMAETAALSLTLAQHGAVPCTLGARADCAALFAASGSGPLGVPLPLWGLAAYALAFVLALGARTPGTPRVLPMALGVLASAMGLVSVALMIRMRAVGALCPWCIGSAVLSVALAALVARTRPAPVAFAGGGALALVWLLALAYAPVHEARVSRAQAVYAARLAEHLRTSGARFYGAWWCTGCREQKERFGPSARELPYVECSVEPVPEDVREFPTWVIGGQSLTGVQSLATLAARSHFAAPPAEANRSVALTAAR